MKMHVIDEMRAIKRKTLYESKYFNILYAAHECDVGERADSKHMKWILDDMKYLCNTFPIISGNDIVALGIIGPRVGELKELCHDAQLRGDFDSHATGIEYLKGLLESD